MKFWFNAVDFGSFFSDQMELDWQIQIISRYAERDARTNSTNPRVSDVNHPLDGTGLMCEAVAEAIKHVFVQWRF